MSSFLGWLLLVAVIAFIAWSPVAFSHPGVTALLAIAAVALIAYHQMWPGPEVVALHRGGGTVDSVAEGPTTSADSDSPIETAKGKHGVPALMSFFIPGLGQLIKGDFLRALLIWAWLGLGTYLAIIMMMSSDGGGGGTMIALSLPIVWAWNLFDAYNH